MCTKEYKNDRAALARMYDEDHLQRIMKIKDSVALVTGANRGLGLSFLKALRAGGAKKIYAGARDPKAAPAVEGVEWVPLDVTKPEAVLALAKKLGDVSLLVNNAGVLISDSLLSANAVANARTEIETNVIGPLLTTQAFAPVLAANGGGAVINVLSVLSWVTLPPVATYSASKAAAWSLTNATRNELRAQRTQVLGLHVGYMDTDMAKSVTQPKSNPDDVARGALAALEQGADEYLADDVSRFVKGGLSQTPAVYTQPVPE